MPGRAFTYPETGATAQPDLPAGYRTVERAVSLGRGGAVHDRACTALMSWEMHRGAGLGVESAATTVHPGAVVVLRVGRGPLSVTAPCRVVYAVDEPSSRGFAYGTLPGHPESGEEQFLITRADDDVVTFTVRAFSRPATLLARLGGPLTPLVQDVITRRYLTALRTIADRAG